MTEQEKKNLIKESLIRFGVGLFLQNSLALFSALGYESDKRRKLTPNTPQNFLTTFAEDKSFNSKKALVTHWQSVDLLFQLTDEELGSSDHPRLPFDSSKKMDTAIIQSYLFFGIHLNGAEYTRTELSDITREINKLFPMPVMVLFRHDAALTLAIINRRLHKKDSTKDVLEKVTLIKDISVANPHRAHIEILYDLSLEALYEKHQFSTFVELHEAWRKTLDISLLNKRFFQEVANWYFWAINQSAFPKPSDVQDEDAYQAQSLIRLITRLIFCWFLKEKGLVPESLFSQKRAAEILIDFRPEKSTFYKAILQNLFFATLNQEMDKREFRKDGQNLMAHNLYRYKRLLKDPEEALKLFGSIPFLNGGLFECLDKTSGTKDKPIYARFDGFSDRDDNPLSVPNFLFFGEEQEADLSQAYGDARYGRAKVRGLIQIFDRYKFTINENTPIEEEIALDPELLGKVFENLLAAYNPETGATARKQTGSFYTPREIVNYMVEESLIACLKEKLQQANTKVDSIEIRLRHLFGYNDEPHQFTPEEGKILIEAIDSLKILDPACGSGAFPMGILHKLVFILSKVDPGNEQWKAKQIAKASEIPDSTVRERVIADIEQTFSKNELDYGRKLYLIENCIYGVDIQAIACQISKLRFFISLIVDQKIELKAKNLGVRPLPNLETKFVAANTLIKVERPGQQLLRNPAIDKKEAELRRVREHHFVARTPATKWKYREQDEKLRVEIGELLRADGYTLTTVTQLSHWDPYDQNLCADFFDPEWMFGLMTGFDIAIGNPPYVRHEELKELKPAFKEQYVCFTGAADLYVYFYERSIQLLKTGGILSFISSNKYFRSGYGEKLRSFLSRETQLLQVIDFGDTPVFTSIGYPSIVLLAKRPPNGNEARVLSWDPGLPIEEFPSIFTSRSFKMGQRELTADGWRLESQAVLRLLDKLRKAGKPLAEYVNGRFYYGIKTGLNEAFVVDRETRDRLIAASPSVSEVLKPFLRGRDVKRWKVNFSHQYLIKIESSENRQHSWSGKPDKEAEKVFAKTYSSIFERFKGFREALKNRDDQGKYYWELRSCAYWQAFEQPKIVIPAIADSVEYAGDKQGFYSNDKTSICVSDEIPFLLGLLNSRLLWWVIQRTAASKQGGFYEFKPMYVSVLPIPSVAKTEKSLLIKASEKAIATKHDYPEKDMSALEGEIDQIVYGVYGLNTDEIKLIEDGNVEKKVKGTHSKS